MNLNLYRPLLYSLVLIGVLGGFLALALSHYFSAPSGEQPGSEDSKPTFKDFPTYFGGSLTSIFGQHPSHGIFPDSKPQGISVAMAAYFAAAVFAIAIITMQYVRFPQSNYTTEL